MGTTTALLWAEPEARYDFGGDHPLRPERVMLTVVLIRACGLDRLPGVEVLAPQPATDEEIALVHDPAYIDLVKRLGAGEPAGPQAAAAGLGWGDNPVFPGMHEATAWVVGATLAAVQAVAGGPVAHAFNPAGGLHHGARARASGFCIYNDPAVAIAWVRRKRPEWRVLYVDVDVHHGDGVQEIFWEDPRVMTVSLHQSGAHLFPGTGFSDELGGGQARGTKVNLPLPPGTSDAEYLEALGSLVPGMAGRFRPDLLVTQLGCDTHWTDPLADLGLSMRAYPAIYGLLHRVAHESCGGRWVATGGGGYQWLRVVPRAWTMAFAEMCADEPGGGLLLLPEEIPGWWPGPDLAGSLPRGFTEDEGPRRGAAAGVAAALEELRSALGLGG